MSKLEIKKYPDPCLRIKAKEVDEITPEIKKLIEEMVLLMGKDKGVGLAATQVGVPKRIIVFETGEGVTALINPKIIKKGKKKFVDMEGCLSFPDIWIKVKRPERIHIQGQDMLGRKVDLGAEMMVSRVLQHELDHLDGILFIDRINPLQKLKIRKKLGELKKKYVSDRKSGK